MRLRLRTVSKIAAAWLVVLIVLPFTAPWGTCDLTDLRGAQTPRDGLAKTTVSPDETLVPPTSAAPLPPALTLVIVLTIERPDRIIAPPVQHAVLRI